MAYPNQQGVGGALAAIAAGLMQAKAGGLRGQAQGLMEREKLDRDAMSRALQMAAQARTPEQVGIAQQYMKSMGLDPASVGLGGSIPETMPPRPLPPIPGEKAVGTGPTPASAPLSLGAEPPNLIAAGLRRADERARAVEDWGVRRKVTSDERAETSLDLAKKRLKLARAKERRLKRQASEESRLSLKGKSPAEIRQARGAARTSMEDNYKLFAQTDDPTVRANILQDIIGDRRDWEATHAKGAPS